MGCRSSPGPATLRSALPELAWVQVCPLASANHYACLERNNHLAMSGLGDHRKHESS